MAMKDQLSYLQKLDIHEHEIMNSSSSYKAHIKSMDGCVVLYSPANIYSNYLIYFMIHLHIRRIDIIIIGDVYML